MQTVSTPVRSNLLRQRAMWCLCGRPAPAGGGFCRACMARNRWDRAHFGGLRELVLRRDGRSCQGCGQPQSGRWTIAVHHREPGLSRSRRMITLCPGCHAMIHRMLVLRRELTPLLQELWREQHPEGHEQLHLRFDRVLPPYTAAGLYGSGNLFDLELR